MARWSVRTFASFAFLLGSSTALGQPETPSQPQSAPIAGGFRMEGDAKIETVFGDSAQFKRTVDHFFRVYPDMQKVHEDFAHNVQSVIASLTADLPAQGAAKKCPTDAVALAYERAFKQGRAFQKLGKELEAQYVSIKELNSLGETRGLTPDYRWKVARSLKLYDGILTDFREMQVEFQEQLSSELAFHACDPQALVARGEEIEKTGPPPPAPAAAEKPAKRGKKADARKAEATPIAASTITFFVDNSSCPTAVRVVLDGAQLGEVGSAAKAAFRALVGPHDLCLIPQTSTQACGDPGTLRKMYIHDGWSIALRCD